MEFPASDFGILGDLSAIAPQLILAFGALFLLIAEVFVRRPWPRHVFALVFLAAAFAATFRSAAYYGTQVETLFSGLLYVDTFSLFFNALIILGTFVVVLISGHRIAAEGVESPAEYFSLLLMSTLGAIIFVSAAEGVVLFIGLELMSLALYCLCGSGLAVRRSGESALKYFLLGSFASAFLLSLIHI